MSTASARVRCEAEDSEVAGRLLGSCRARDGPFGQRDWTRAKEEQWSLGMFTGCGQPSFLLNVHFCNSRFPIFSRMVADGGVGGAALSVVMPPGTDMTMLQDHAGELASRSERNSAAPLLLLAR